MILNFHPKIYKVKIGLQHNIFTLITFVLQYAIICM